MGSSGRITIPRLGGSGYRVHLPRHIDSHQLLLALGIAVEGASARLTIRELVEWWSETYLERLASSSDRKRNLGYIVEQLGHCTEDDLGPDTIEQMLGRIEKVRSLEPQSLNHIRNAGSKLIQDAIHSRRWNAPNPFRAVSRRQVNRREPDMLTPFEAGKLLSVLPSERASVFAVAIYLGLRCGEIRALRVEDYSRDRRLLAVRRSGQRATTKTKSERVVPVPNELVRYLEFAVTCAEVAGSEWLFQDESGEQLSKDFKPCDTLRQALREIGLGARRLTFHGLRHVSCTLHQEAGCHPLVVSRVLGHSIAGMTVRYTHLSEGMCRSELNKLSLRHSQQELDLTSICASSSAWIEQRPSKPLLVSESPAQGALSLAADPLVAKFLKWVNKTPAGCWRWTGRTDDNGYGRISVRGEYCRAHRLSWEIENGKPVPDGGHVLHSCDNRSCVNPHHLRIGTAAENQADKVSRDRQARGEQNGRAKLSAADVCNILSRHAAGELQADLAREFRVTEKAIRLIRQGRNWKHLRVVGGAS